MVFHLENLPPPEKLLRLLKIWNYHRFLTVNYIPGVGVLLKTFQWDIMYFISHGHCYVRDIIVLPLTFGVKPKMFHFCFLSWQPFSKLIFYASKFYSTKLHTYFYIIMQLQISIWSNQFWLCFFYKIHISKYNKAIILSRFIQIWCNFEITKKFYSIFNRDDIPQQ